MHWMGWMDGGWLMMIFRWAIIIGVIYLVVRALTTDRNSRQSKEETALEILKKRYVRDEISKEEYEQKKKDIL
jgi:putative membrane protein